MTKRLTDRSLKAFKLATAGTHYDVMDSDVRGLGVRVSDTSKRFVLVARYSRRLEPDTAHHWRIPDRDA